MIGSDAPFRLATSAMSALDLGSDLAKELGDTKAACAVRGD